jgi:ParB-like nuclease domain
MERSRAKRHFSPISTTLTPAPQVFEEKKRIYSIGFTNFVTKRLSRGQIMSITPQTQVRIKSGTAKKRIGKVGVVTNEPPTDSNRDKVPVYLQLGKDTGTYWYSPDELEISPPQETDSPQIVTLALNLIRRDGGTQTRVAVDQSTVEEYAENMKEGIIFPPVVVFYDGQDYWLSDGFHRVLAAELIGQPQIPAEVKQGSRRDAILESVGANAAHGLRRTNADKRQAVLTLFQDPEWANWSDRSIAKRTNTTHPFVAKIRAGLAVRVTTENEQLNVTGNVSGEITNNTNTTSEGRIYRTKHGTLTQMNTSKRSLLSTAPPLELKENAPIAISSIHSLFPGRNGVIITFPNQDTAIVELDTGARELIAKKYLEPRTQLEPSLPDSSPKSVAKELKNQEKHLGLNYNQKIDQVLPTVERNHQNPTDIDDVPFAPPAPSRVEVNPNDIVVALISNLDILSEAQIYAVGKAIATREPHQAKAIIRGLLQNAKLAKAMVEEVA